MEENEEIQDGAYVGKILSPSTPEDLKEAFGMLVDWVRDQASESSDILDWGSFTVHSQNALNPDTGQELIYFHVKIRAIGTGFIDDDDS